MTRQKATTRERPTGRADEMGAGALLVTRSFGPLVASKIPPKIAAVRPTPPPAIHATFTPSLTPAQGLGSTCGRPSA